jgi:hypothetical protein
MGCKLCKSVDVDNNLKSANDDDKTNNDSDSNPHNRSETLTSVNSQNDLRRGSWKIRASSIGPFVVTTENGEIEDHVTVLEGDDLFVTPENSPLLLERCPVLFEDDDDGRGSVGSQSSSNSSNSVNNNNNREMSDEWSSASSGPGALCLKNSSTRRAAFQVRYIDGQMNSSKKCNIKKDVLATPESGVLEAGSSLDIEVLLAAIGLSNEEEAELTVRDDRLLITALWFDDHVNLDDCSPNELDVALSKLWKDKLGTSKRYRVRIALSEPMAAPQTIEDNNGEGGDSAMKIGVLNENLLQNASAGPNVDEQRNKINERVENIDTGGGGSEQIENNNSSETASSSSSSSHHETSTIVSSQSQMSVTTSSVIIAAAKFKRGDKKHHGISRIAARRKTSVLSQGRSLNSFSNNSSFSSIASTSTSSSSSIIARASRIFSRPSFKQQLAKRFSSSGSVKASSLSTVSSMDNSGNSSSGSGLGVLEGLYEEEEEDDDEYNTNDEHQRGGDFHNYTTSKSPKHQMNEMEDFLKLEEMKGNESGEIGIDDKPSFRDRISKALQGTAYLRRTIDSDASSWKHHCVLQTSDSTVASQHIFLSSVVAYKENIVLECLRLLEEDYQLPGSNSEPWVEGINKKICGNVLHRKKVNVGDRGSSEHGSGYNNEIMNIKWSRICNVLKNMEDGSRGSNDSGSGSRVSYLSKKIALLTAPDHDYRSTSTLAMRVQAGTLSPGPMAMDLLGAYSAVSILSLRRNLQMNCFLDPRQSNKSRNYENSRIYGGSEEEAVESPYINCGANVLRVYTDRGPKLIVVDDVIPITNDNRMVFAEDRSGLDSFFPLLFNGLLKCCAPATINGVSSFQSRVDVLSSLSVEDAMQLLTGARSTKLPISTTGSSNRSTWLRMLTAMADADAVGVTAAPQPNDASSISKEGLVYSFTYSVLDVREVSVDGNTKRFVLLHNPFRPKNVTEVNNSNVINAVNGGSGERGTKKFPHWIGKWSTYGPTVSETWEKYPEVQSTLLPISRGCRRDSFWIDFDEVSSLKLIDSIIIFHLNAQNGWKQLKTKLENGIRSQKHDNSRLSIEVPPKPSTIVHLHRDDDMPWCMRTVRGRWSESTAGGSCDFSTWRDNSQFTVEAPTRATRVLVTLSIIPTEDGNDGMKESMVVKNGFEVKEGGVRDGNEEKELVGKRRKKSLLPKGIALYSFPAREDGRSVVSPAIFAGFSRAGQVGFMRTVSRSSVTLELSLGPATGPIVLIPCTTLPRIIGQFELNVLYEAGGSGGSTVVVTPVSSPRSKLKWNVYEHRGAWLTGLTAGGCRLTKEFGRNTCFVAKMSSKNEEKEVGMKKRDTWVVDGETFNQEHNRECKMYAVVSFSGGNQLLPLIAGCHCFDLPSRSSSIGDDIDHDNYNVNLSEVATNSIETFKIFGTERMSLTSTVLEEHQDREREMSIGTAAFVEFEVSATSSSIEREVVFVPCSQNSDVTGNYTLRVYSTIPLIWSSMSLETLEENINAPQTSLYQGESGEDVGGGDDEDEIQIQTAIEGQWTLGVLEGEKSLCGGCRNYETWLENPSFSIPVVEDCYLIIDLSCRFEYNRLLTSQIPAAGMYLLAGNEKIANDIGSWVVEQSSFVRGERNKWKVMLKGCDVPYTLVVCTYQPKCRGQFTITVTKLNNSDLEVI